MKKIFLFASILFSCNLYSQDSIKLNQIDSVVRLINTSDFKIQTDTIIRDQPELGLSMRTYLTMLTNGTELKKYVNNVHTALQENGVPKKIVATNTFYFDNNKLIKVEELAISGESKLEALWYYAEDKP